MNSSSFPVPQVIDNGNVLTREEFVTVAYVLAYVTLVMSLVGMVTNTINIRTFVSMGLNDGVTVCLIGLAISDLGQTIFTFVLSSANILGVVEETYKLTNLPIHPRGVFSTFSVNIALMFFQVSCLITTFMAIARCMCVAMPFQFKNYFSRSKSVTAMIVFVISALSCYLPLLSQMGVQWKFDPVVNKSRIVQWMSDSRSNIKDAVSFIHLIMIVFVSTFVVAVCVVVMFVHLRESVRFRHNASSSAVTPSTGSERGQDDDPEGKSECKFSGKELQVLRQVIVICFIYTVCMLPALAIALYRLADSSFDVGKSLAYFYYIASDVAVVFALVNAGTTFLVYFKFNSKFRSHCSALWRTPNKSDTNSK